MVGCFHDQTGTTMTAMRGYVVTKEGTTAFEYPSDQPFSMFYGATPNGKTLVGAYWTRPTSTTFRKHGFLLEDGEIISIDVPGSILTEAYDINPAGETIGTYTTADKKMHGFLVETRGLAVKDWKFTTIDFPGTTVTMTHLRGINAGGDIVGDYVSGGQLHGFLASRTGR
jgi:uncharacterized membrane protein